MLVEKRGTRDIAVRKGQISDKGSPNKNVHGTLFFQGLKKIIGV